MRRQRVGGRRDRRIFSQTAGRVNSRNHVAPMRGGYRL